jgi:hypothetical protein
MKVLEPHYITLEQAKWLKEIEFRESCNQYYTKGTNLKSYELSTCQTFSWIWKEMSGNRYNKHDVFLAPEQHQVIEWLRVNYNIHVTYDVGILGYYGLVKTRNKSGAFYLPKWVNEQENPLSSPQEAYSTAFDYIKRNLTKGGENE